MSAELWRKCAHELAELIRSKQVSSREVIQSHLDRIAVVNDKVNAVTVTLAESALLAADRADATKPIGPLHGVQVYAERWREDLCLDVAGLLEASVGRITPIDPVS